MLGTAKKVQDWKSDEFRREHPSQRGLAAVQELWTGQRKQPLSYLLAKSSKHRPAKAYLNLSSSWQSNRQLAVMRVNGSTKSMLPKRRVKSGRKS